MIIYSVSLAVFTVPALQLRDMLAAPVSLPQSMISTLSVPLGEYAMMQVEMLCLKLFFSLTILLNGLIGRGFTLFMFVYHHNKSSLQLK